MSKTKQQIKPFDAEAFITEGIKQIQKVYLQSHCPHIHWVNTSKGQKCSNCELEVNF